MVDASRRIAKHGIWTAIDRAQPGGLSHPLFGKKLAREKRSGFKPIHQSGFVASGGHDFLNSFMLRHERHRNTHALQGADPMVFGRRVAFAVSTVYLEITDHGDMARPDKEASRGTGAVLG